MKAGQTLPELVTEVMRVAESRADFIAPTTDLQVRHTGDGYLMDVRDQAFLVRDWPHSQLATDLKIPAPYYQAMRERKPDLLCENINTWLADHPRKRLVRTLDGQARAYLSDRYHFYDNYELLSGALPVLNNTEGLRYESLQVTTDDKLYIKAVTDRIGGEVRKGDVVQAGIVLSNSEVGKGRVSVDQLVYRLICLNGAVMPDTNYHKTHIGRSLGDDGRYFQSDTIKAENELVWRQVRDTVAGFLNEEVFEKVIRKLRGATEEEITGHPEAAVEMLGNRFAFSDQEKADVFRRLCGDADFTQYGLLNAVTAVSQSIESYDRASDFEEIGGRILNLSSDEWTTIATAT